MYVIRNANFALSGKSKDQPKDFNNCLIQKVITAINILDGSTLGDNLIMSHQVDDMLLISAEAFENNQKHLVANKVGSITSLV